MSNDAPLPHTCAFLLPPATLSETNSLNWSNASCNGIASSFTIAERASEDCLSHQDNSRWIDYGAPVHGGFKAYDFIETFSNRAGCRVKNNRTNSDDRGVMFFTHGFQINHNVNIINWLIFLLIMMTGFNIYRIRLMNNFICFFFLVIDLPQAGSTWTLRLRKITPDANSVKVGDVMTLQSYTEVIDAKLRYPQYAAGTGADR